MSFPFFLEMAWKSALIAGGALALATFLKSRSAADRAAVLRLGIALLLALPLISLLLPALQWEVAAAAADEVQPALLSPVMTDTAAYTTDLPAMATVPESTIWDDPSLLIATAYLGGLLMAALRLGAGLLTLQRWTRSAAPVACPEWISAFDRVRDGRNVRLLVSPEAPSPLSWGWLSPAILIDRDTLDRPEDAEAILEHEMAHVIRRDWPMLMLARVASVLFWFNPLVRLLERSFVQHSEEAADCHALGRVEPTFYAQTLLGCASHASRSALPANSIASQGLARRVKAILDGRVRATKSGSFWTFAAMIACVVFAAPLAALELTKKMPEPPEAPAAPKGAALAPIAPQAALAPLPPAAPLAAAAPLPPKPRHMSQREYDKLAAAHAEIPGIVASAMASIDADEIGRATEEAMREVRAVSGTEISIAVREAQREARRATLEAQRATREAMREVERSKAHGAGGMEAGARSMEAGAKEMAETAHKLRTSKAYREKQIAEAAARGEHVTHEELIEAADGLEEGSHGLREGARGMREAAAEMRGHNIH
jgi:bla regulator protein blaR1